jgi:hypothetical protein
MVLNFDENDFIEARPGALDGMKSDLAFDRIRNWLRR